MIETLPCIGDLERVPKKGPFSRFGGGKTAEMFKAYKDMKNDPKGTVFADFYRDLSVRRNIGECEPRHHAQIMCVMVHYKKKAL